MSFHRNAIDTSLVRRLLTAQFPDWAKLPLRPVAQQGWDNRTFRLGNDLAVRLPSAARYAAQVDKEQTWLPRLAANLPLAIPIPIAKGKAGEGYPWPWSVYRWLEGEPAATGRIDDRKAFAATLAKFLVALQRIDAASGPPSGEHSFHRGGSLAIYDSETRRAIAILGDSIDAKGARDVWEKALSTPWSLASVWFHGDVAASNLLVREGCLAAVIDFGCCGVGDPACDLVIAWTFLDAGRDAFRAVVALDDPTWARARGWALWKALIVLAGLPGTNQADADHCSRIIETVVAEHRRTA